jgi:hypothetical protein
VRSFVKALNAFTDPSQASFSAGAVASDVQKAISNRYDRGALVSIAANDPWPSSEVADEALSGTLEHFV